MVTLDEIKLYLRIDEVDEDGLIESLIEYSKEAILDATGATGEKYGNLETYKMLQRIIVTDRYENRSSTDGDFKPNNSCSGMYMKLRLKVESDEKESSKQT